MKQKQKLEVKTKIKGQVQNDHVLNEQHRNFKNPTVQNIKVKTIKNMVHTKKGLFNR